MSRFIETICFEKGAYSLLPEHQLRVNSTFAAHYPEAAPHQLATVLPALSFDERYKVRVVYDAELTEVEFSQYTLRALRRIQLVRDDSISYRFKSENRKALTRLFEQRGLADEILIVKKGAVTDGYYANVAFWDGECWWTPDTYLLNGVRRQHLLNTGKIREKMIREEDLRSFEKVSLINAMVNLGESELPVSEIHGINS
ncbi:aminotransferase class IV [Marinoscillum sp.]|uniref:aminotransferase class IV n=1 Tax=Marinoscillum sp. TaxID=2024838 RepID=UPI003BAD12F6